ncbi:hypothetical protein TNIN_467031 [Trichonephila inaurata madagascariensis]|uniref:Uncharacterized protein n=1 Tax=Trichonephila inaurata madagascariensis TaxID=2747483 RepID=A0A8X6MG52_9ARAC|nr:hypothetical protein TNIN_467031 [Trichonephila inaurata madagascariensis]
MKKNPGSEWKSNPGKRSCHFEIEIPLPLPVEWKCGLLKQTPVWKTGKRRGSRKGGGIECFPVFCHRFSALARSMQMGSRAGFASKILFLGGTVRDSFNFALLCDAVNGYIIFKVILSGLFLYK